jgi:hypothetical protein
MVLQTMKVGHVVWEPTGSFVIFTKMHMHPIEILKTYVVYFNAILWNAPEPFK